MGKEGPAKQKSSGLAYKVCLAIEKSKIAIEESLNMPSIEDYVNIKLRVDSFCRIKAVGSAYLKDLYWYGFLPSLLGLQNGLH